MLAIGAGRWSSGGDGCRRRRSASDEAVDVIKLSLEQSSLTAPFTSPSSSLAAAAAVRDSSGERWILLSEKWRSLHVTGGLEEAGCLLISNWRTCLTMCVVPSARFREAESRVVELYLN